MTDTPNALPAVPVVRRSDYRPSDFLIEHVDLTFDLEPSKTRVLNKMRVRRNPAVDSNTNPSTVSNESKAPSALRLDGEDLNLARVLVNGAGTSFKIENNQLVLENLPQGEAAFDLEIFTTCAPDKNTQLMGLFISQNTFYTQCEPEGFRRITYFLDRPDIMASYDVTIRADKTLYPVLLSNGNLLESGDLEDNRHFVKWQDPHKKPCYLFALVAGHLVCREQKVISKAGHEHLLQFYVKSGDLEKTQHAMQSLMQSIAWDEVRFGLPLDLERFMVVATGDFNMGAMENKGLNIFNTKFVLASAATATDVDFANVQGVVAHEYFHNWTGNRVTCRDWFQLSLKEGLTVFRDQEFSMDMAGSQSARAVKRIEDVRMLRLAQFAEDAGPMAHPVRPESYVQINNFYTMTIYEKGAEVVRMIQTLVGKEGFRAGMDLYFSRHDGQAVTCDDFAQSMADANPNSLLYRHLEPFKRWYSQAGTPRVQIRTHYAADTQTFTLSISQSTPTQSQNQPFVIPLKTKLIFGDGSSFDNVLYPDNVINTNNLSQNTDLSSHNSPSNSAKGTEFLLLLTDHQHTFTLHNVSQKPLLSILRGFSAPVILDSIYNEEDLLAQLMHDDDPFNRWEAAQSIVLQSIINAYQSAINEKTQNTSQHDIDQGLNALDSHRTYFNANFIATMRSILMDDTLDCAFIELIMTLPSENYVFERLQNVDPQVLHQVREKMRLELAQTFHSQWQTLYHKHANTTPYTPDAYSAGRRALANLAISMLCLSQSSDENSLQTLSNHDNNIKTYEPYGSWHEKALQRLQNATNMTDGLGALSALVNCASPLAQAALDYFYKGFAHDDLALDKWFALQAASCDVNGHVLGVVRKLMQHKAFNIKNPNRARSVLFSFCNQNLAAFHRQDAAGYVLWSEQLLTIDAFNPQMAARFARALERWKNLAQPYRDSAHTALMRVHAKNNLSLDTREVIEKALA